ncbi:MAG: hypothetical protein HYR64_10500 [Fimbriimonas ginsengisoli]|uniref:Outer membrane protein beta-barrel domain-containing protein n=1 Tax=Fimbriimonas ginsengisoli TaxID=1005039 RepID=A0A931LU59_FIMGI|nr:hypothetical protein [Fimbriimonas ginsengisoli]
MDRRLVAAAAGMAILGTAFPAWGQESKPVGLSVKAGLFWPSSSAGRNAGSTWFAGGAEFRVRDASVETKGIGPNSTITASLDYYNKGGFSNMPVLLNVVTHTSEMYYTVGAGVGFNRTPDGSGGTDSKTRFAWQAGVGYDFMQGKSPLFVEGKYFGNASSDLNGFGVFVGIHI